MKPTNEQVITAARKLHVEHSDDDTMIHDDAAVEVVDDGYWVTAQVWVPGYKFEED